MAPGSVETTSRRVGRATSTTRAPSTGAASSSPPCSTSQLPSGTSVAPPRDTPVEDTEMALARCSMNHLASIELTDTEAPMPKATAISA